MVDSEVETQKKKKNKKKCMRGFSLLLQLLCLAAGMMAVNRSILAKVDVETNNPNERLIHSQNASSIPFASEFPPNPNPTCQQLQESFGIDFASVSATHAFASRRDFFLENNRLPEDPRFDEKEEIEWVLDNILHRLPRGVQRLPRDWSAMEGVLAKLVKRYQYLKNPNETNNLPPPPPPPPVTVVVMGGSVAMGMNCDSHGLTEYRCAWAFRLESFLHRLAGLGDTYHRRDDDTKLIRILNKSVGGLNSADGERLLRYEMFDTNEFDVIINSYGTNDMHIKTIKEAERLGLSLADYSLAIKQDFIRTALSLPSICDDNNQKQQQSPLVLLLNDYIGNEQRSVLETMEGEHIIDLVASYYGLGAISYPSMINDMVYANTTHQNLSPPWYDPTKDGDMQREVHYGAVFHRIAVLLISYYAWMATTTFCGMVVWSNSHYKDSMRTGLPPPLTNDLVLDTISEEWKEHDRLRRDFSEAVGTNESVPSCVDSNRCSFSWISTMPKTNNDAEFFAPYIHEPTSTWTLVDTKKRFVTGWSPPRDGVGKSFALDIPLTTRPVKNVIFYIEKAKGYNSTASIEILQSTVEDSWESVLGPRFVSGEHDQKRRNVYIEEWTLPRDVVPPNTLRIRLVLKEGHTFKLTGIGACDVGGDRFGSNGFRNGTIVVREGNSTSESIPK